jgi:hypothetical protein
MKRHCLLIWQYFLQRPYPSWVLKTPLPLPPQNRITIRTQTSIITHDDVNLDDTKRHNVAKGRKIRGFVNSFMYSAQLNYMPSYMFTWTHNCSCGRLCACNKICADADNIMYFPLDTCTICSMLNRNHRPDTIDSSPPANAGSHSTTRHQGAFKKQNSL